MSVLSAPPLVDDEDRLYAAWCARDARYDGRAFLAVRTTGVYCRPVCPARTPHRRNVRFFRCAAAAEAAGFRPCRRCRPEAAPGTPAWNGTVSTVARALRMIERGVLEESSVATLATRLGVGDRHLRRLFLRHLGATPIAVARTRRIHFAKRLLEETSMPVSRIAMHAGFPSLRQLNHDFRATFRATPTTIRRRFPGTGERGVRLVVSARPPLGWQGLLAFLGPRATPGVEEVVGETLRRVVLVGGRPTVIEARPAGKGHGVEITITPPPERELLAVVARVRRMFDLDADLERIGETLSRDPRLAARLAGGLPPRVPGAFDPFELAVRAILGQQVSVAAATTLAGRLVRSFGRPLATGVGSLERAFPAAAVLVDADVASIGIPRSRGRAIQGLARAFASGSLRLESMATPEEIVRALVALPGIGRWTADYVAMRALGEPDAFPSGDLGLQRALGGIGEKELASASEAWRPWRAYAAMLLWRTG